jgi:SAM-dependent MidA family methyltransferase
MTPSEVFQPWYGRALARWALRCRERDGEGEDAPLNVVEIGAGNGTCALNFLDLLREERPRLYARTRYTAVELSPTLAEGQRRRLVAHGERFSSEDASAATRSVLEPAGTFVIGCEVLDNMPHDKVLEAGGGALFESWVERASAGGEPVEILREAKDPLVLEAWALFCDAEASAQKRVETERFSLARLLHSLQSSVRSAADSVLGEGAQAKNLAAANAGGRVVYLPTTALAFLHRLRDCFPCHRLFLADFDSLPQPLPGVNGPLVAAQVGGRTVELTSVLQATGQADVFFPTDFSALALAHARVCGGLRQPRVMQHGAFMAEFSEIQHLRTKSGYNAGVSDYGNVSVLLVD